MAGQRGFQSLVGALALVGLSDPVAGQEALRPWIVVTVFNDASLAAETLARAEAHVARIYGDLGVDLVWADPTRTDASGRFLAHLIIRRMPPRPRMMGNALGDARGAGGTAFVYSDRVRDVAHGRNLDIALVLAYAMAHEMGHLLLPAPSHAVAGIMHADWDGADFRNMAADALRFTSAQANAIRARASVSAGVAAQRGGLLPAAPFGQTSPMGPHVRTDDPKLRKLIDRGLTQSSTFRDIVCRIDRLGGLVHVVASRCGSLSRLSACLDHDVRVRGGIRYLRINMLPGEPEARQLRLLAHELQHALEVLSDETATSQESVARLYERIGMRRPGVGNFETDAALRVQKEVARQLSSYGKTQPGAAVSSEQACAAEP